MLRYLLAVMLKIKVHFSARRKK